MYVGSESPRREKGSPKEGCDVETFRSGKWTKYEVKKRECMKGIVMLPRK